MGKYVSILIISACIVHLCGGFSSMDINIFQSLLETFLLYCILLVSLPKQPYCLLCTSSKKRKTMSLETLQELEVYKSLNKNCTAFKDLSEEEKVKVVKYWCKWIVPQVNQLIKDMDRTMDKIDLDLKNINLDAMKKGEK